MVPDLSFGKVMITNLAGVVIVIVSLSKTFICSCLARPLGTTVQMPTVPSEGQGRLSSASVGHREK